MKNVIGILTLIFVLSFQQGCRKSEFLTVTGVVRDSLTHEPIKGAYIITGDGKYYVSASDGTFTIDRPQEGNAAFRVVSFMGYKEEIKNVRLTNDRVNKIDFNLKPLINPEIQTGRVTNITSYKAVVTGSFKMKEGMNVYRYGHCWSFSTSFPTLDDCTGNSSNWYGSGEMSFTSFMNGLSSNTVYFVRAYAETNAGMVYGNTVVFKTSVLEVSDGLIAYFPFTNSFEDQSGNGNPFYLSGVYLTGDRFGNSANAMACASDCMAYSFSELFGSFDQFSFAFWFKKSSWSGTETTMINIGYPFYSNEIRIGEDASPNKIFFSIKTQSGLTYTVPATSIPSLNTWHHLVAQRDHSSIQLYLDGVLQGSVSCDNQSILNYTAGGNNGYIFFGFDLKFWPWKYYSGLLDDIRIYNRALTTTEIDYLKSH